MTITINLSSRLTEVANFINKGAKFADIGSDHAYLPCYICLKDKTARAIAGEINEGPFNSAKNMVSATKLNDVIEVRLGNGLEIITQDDNIDHVVIAGMGGSLIKTILEEGKKKLTDVKRIIAQPNIDARNVRRWFVSNNFKIINESIIEENGHIYEIIVAEQTKSLQMDILNEKELLFGPILLRNKKSEFYKKWQHEYEKMQQVVAQMKSAKVRNTEKIVQFEKELVWMEEEL
ncbi:tRNA (adenine(22)-N(1))-methyltransferase TrmK [Oceanobacillus caeni]|uniref:tRNA (adenine(22)-N(1))-methyltransferase n=1 Tax=Bacillaceae TaxID=186817 RepID=UPI00069B8BC9|nr:MULTISPECIES: tRNA (adenine(22)-N(1))-methyltransferase TrmK [Bacillaceae]PZD88971.1 tRNA (adenine-N(1))-methyltransferase [Bacilli bacterium]MBU8789448.1 tRNA (adenine(22)-N(1))-methyltransferase TrmK [Oceanobacillus caeni]MCR1833860.1 tRNA (adenine(22)-N(1))-methyltransferase TrmK [Oceanobacillus caeni]MED4474584.1 tRNA (adenine(22)-N(1))-methyltransferase TrmK [Oceanobacillus caeni]PZD92399.1 tRNA (adenine-N(1))-methyltransferase [Bacilli bacterium]